MILASQTLQAVGATCLIHSYTYSVVLLKDYQSHRGRIVGLLSCHITFEFDQT